MVCFWRPAAQVLVYPAPEPAPPPLPPGEPRAGGAALAAVQAPGEYDGVRPYRRGDPLKTVVWKKVARADQLARAVGWKGSMAEYVHATVSKLEELGIHDRNLWLLQDLIAQRIEAAYPADREV